MKTNSISWMVAFTLYTIVQVIGLPFLWIYSILHWFTGEYEKALVKLEKDYLK